MAQTKMLLGHVKGEDGIVSWPGTSSQIVLADGTAQDISEFITNNAEAIRTAIGVFSDSANGLVPKAGE